MKSKPIIISILAIGFFIYTVWSFIDWAKDRQNKTWSDSQIESMITKCISSSKYLSSIGSNKAYDVCKCATEKLIQTYSYDEIWKLDSEQQDTLIQLFTPIMSQCMFPLIYESKFTTITDTIQLKWIVKDLTSFWTPKNDDLRLAESVVENAIKENNNEYWSILDTLTAKKYYRQYVFYTDSNNDSIIYINAFCNLLDIPTDSSGVMIMKPYDWQNNLMIVDDGGDCYWSIKINLTKMTYFDFMVNGEA